MELAQEFFHRLYQFDELIRWGGYTVLFCVIFAETGLLAGFFLPGDSLLVTAGLLAATGGILEIEVLIAVLMAAAILGDTIGYSIGFFLGPRIFNKEDSLLFHRDHLVRTQRFYEKYGPKTIVLARFVPLVRTFAPTVAGVARMRYRTFLIYNVAGGVGWVLSMTLAGYFLGRVLPNFEHYLHWLILGIIAVSFLPVLRELYLARGPRRQ